MTSTASLTVVATGLRCALGALAMLAVGCASDDATRPETTSDYARAVTIEVRDRSGAPAAGAEVWLSLDPFTGLAVVVTGTTDVEGVFADTLAPGVWTAFARVGEDVAGGSFLVNDEAGAPPADTGLVRLALDAAGVVKGRAFLAGRPTHEGIIVSILQIPSLAVTSEDGAWSLPGVPPGRWTTEFFSLGFESAFVTVVLSAPGDTATAPDVTLVSEP